LPGLNPIMPNEFYGTLARAETFLYWAIVAPVEIGAVVKAGVSARNNNSSLGLPNVRLDRSRFPETARHWTDAQLSGKQSILTINRPAARPNRSLSLQGIDKAPGMQLDEYPPAIFSEGGRGASVRAIPSSDNMGSGASIGNQLRSFPDGTKVLLIVE